MPDAKTMTPAEVQAAEDAAAVSGLRKAAIFLIALDADTASKVMKNFDERELSAVSEEMTRIGDVSGEEIEKVLKDFGANTERITVEPMLLEMLEKALGGEKARALMDRIRRRSVTREPFRALRRLSLQQLEQVLSGEHPQVLALVISYMEAQIGFELLRSLEDDVRYDVVRRIASTVEMPFEMVRQVDAILEARARESAAQGTFGDRNRFQTVAQILNFAEPGISKSIMERLGKDLPDAATEIQSLMFVFEDLLLLADRDMQKVLGEVDKADLCLALKTAPREVSDKILANLSKRAREALLEEIEMLGPKPLSEVEEAQKRIIQVVRGLEEKGDVVIQRGGAEEMV